MLSNFLFYAINKLMIEKHGFCIRIIRGDKFHKVDLFTIISEIAELSIPEKILFVEDLWEDINSEEPSVPIPPSHKKELDERFMKYKANPGYLLSLEQLQERLEARK